MNYKNKPTSECKTDCETDRSLLFTGQWRLSHTNSPNSSSWAETSSDSALGDMSLFLGLNMQLGHSFWA